MREFKLKVKDLEGVPCVRLPNPHGSHSWMQLYRIYDLEAVLQPTTFAGVTKPLSGQPS